MVRLLMALLALVSPFAHGAEPELLDPEKAFRFAARIKDARTIEVSYQIAPGYYMYRDNFRFTAAPEAVSLGAPQLPPGKRKRVEFFGYVETYRDQIAIVVPFELAEASVPAISLTAVSQGCADAGVCYVPQEQKQPLCLLPPFRARGEAQRQ